MRLCMTFAVLFAVLFLAEGCLGWVAPSSVYLRGSSQAHPATRRQNRVAFSCVMRTEGGRRDFGIAAAAGLIAVLGLPLEEAHADRSYTSMTTAYRTYAPRIKAGIKFYKEDVRGMIEKALLLALSRDMVIQTFLSMEKNFWGAYVERYRSGVVDGVVELKGIAKIFASSITASDSESITTQKLYQLLMKYAEFNDQILAAAAAGDKAAALKAHTAGSYALKLYIETLNPEIPRSLGKINMEEADATQEAPAADAK